jgi:ABC-type cobalamin/Fe3+-siderophores transport system ATPase subunit
MTRVHRPPTGRILLDGTDLLAMRPIDAARWVAVVSQETAVEFDFTVMEMVPIGRTPPTRGRSRKTRKPIPTSQVRPSTGTAAATWPTAASTPSRRR